MRRVTCPRALEGLRRLILRRRSSARKFVLVVLWLAIAVGVRWLLDRGVYGVPFLTFYPVVLLSGLFLGGQFAVLAAVASLLLARFVFSAAPWHVADTPTRTAMFLVYCVTVAIIVSTGSFVRLILLENQSHIDQAEAFNTELRHRAKNALQVLRALVGRGPRDGEDAASFHAKLLGRMEALGKANELLRYGALQAVPLDRLVASAIAPFDPTRFHCAGPSCMVRKAAATPLVMALHELATNALKYGALSEPAGTVTIAWEARGPETLRLEWRERGGPVVSPPLTHGMGSRLLRTQAGMAGSISIGPRPDWVAPSSWREPRSAETAASPVNGSLTAPRQEHRSRQDQVVAFPSGQMCSARP